MRHHDDLALASRPNHFAYFHYHLARYLVDQGMKLKAKYHYAIATDYRHTPKSYFPAIDMADLAYAKSDYEFMILCTKAAMALSRHDSSDPYFARAHNNLGLAFSKLGKLEQAIDHYKKALAINPNDTVARNNLRRALTNIGKREQAIDQLGID